MFRRYPWWACGIVGLPLLLLAGGCDAPQTSSEAQASAAPDAGLPPSPVAPPPSPTAASTAALDSPAEAKPVAPAADSSAETTQPAPMQTAARRPAEPAPPSSSDSQSDAPTVLLSTGVALAQPTVQGTVMGFSVDYKFTGGEPNASSKYFLVLFSKNEGLEIPVELKWRGNLTKLVPQWKPDQKPFYCLIGEQTADGERRQISKKLRMN